MIDTGTKWTNEQLEDIALSFVQEGDRRGIRLRVLGGVAVRLLCKEIISEHSQLDRLCGDVDIAGLSEDAPQIGEILQRQGFQPHREFNFLNVSSRMLFSKERLKVDVILDEFRMNHRWPIRERLLPGQTVLPFEDLMLTKLQVVHLSEKDVTDLLALGLKSFDESPDISYMKGLCLHSWGFTHTVFRTCQKLTNLNGEILDHNQEQAIGIYTCLADELKHAKKSLKWRIRAMIGERILWYEPAEEPEIENRPAHRERC